MHFRKHEEHMLSRVIRRLRQFGMGTKTCAMIFELHGEHSVSYYTSIERVTFYPTHIQANGNIYIKKGK